MKDHESDEASAVRDVSTAGNTELPVASRFDLEALRLSQNFGETIGVKKLLTTVPVHKPDRQVFVRVHPDEAYRFQTAVIEVKEENETYLLHPSLWPEVSGELVPKTLFTAITRLGVVFLWPVRLPGEDGRLDPWNRSALDAAQLAMHKWVRVASNRSLGAYEVFEAGGGLSEPEWPDLTFEKILHIAFRDQFIDTLQHSVIKRLRGL